MKVRKSDIALPGRLKIQSSKHKQNTSPYTGSILLGLRVISKYSGTGEAIKVDLEGAPQHAPTSTNKHIWLTKTMQRMCMFWIDNKALNH